jgi:hypothetical protein
MKLAAFILLAVAAWCYTLKQQQDYAVINRVYRQARAPRLRRCAVARKTVLFGCDNVATGPIARRPFRIGRLDAFGA